MAARNLLHKNSLEGFKSWLDLKGHEHRPGQGDYQILQIRWGSGWQVLYSRIKMEEHVTVPDPLIPLVKAFIRESRKVTATGTAEKLDTPQKAVDSEAPWD